MAVTRKTSETLLSEYLKRCQEVAFRLTYQALAFLAESCVNRIRDRSAEDSWIDHTGNLRSSIGYLITMNGKPVINGGFKPTSAPEGNGANGQKAGADFANKIAGQYSHKPLVLVVVAGMEYAILVEARDNKDVLAATELWAKAEWPKRLPQLKAAIQKKWDDIAKQMNIA